MKSRRSPASLLARLLDLAKRGGEDYSLVLNRNGLERLLDRWVGLRHSDLFLPNWRSCSRSGLGRWHADRSGGLPA
jgi:hypothetical protein